jgi:hypothetical protein
MLLNINEKSISPLVIVTLVKRVFKELQWIGSGNIIVLVENVTVTGNGKAKNRDFQFS